MFATMKEKANKMGRNRKNFNETVKREVAIEALREQKTVNEIASDHGVSASMVSIGRSSLFREVLPKK